MNLAAFSDDCFQQTLGHSNSAKFLPIKIPWAMSIRHVLETCCCVLLLHQQNFVNTPIIRQLGDWVLFRVHHSHGIASVVKHSHLPFCDWTICYSAKPIFPPEWFLIQYLKNKKTKTLLNTAACRLDLGKLVWRGQNTWMDGVWSQLQCFLLLLTSPATDCHYVPVTAGGL